MALSQKGGRFLVDDLNRIKVRACSRINDGAYAICCKAFLSVFKINGCFKQGRLRSNKKESVTMRILIIKSRSALSDKAKTALKAEVEEAKQTGLLVLDQNYTFDLIKIDDIDTEG